MIKLQLKPAIKNTSSNKSFDDEYVRKLMETLIKLSDSINKIQISSQYIVVISNVMICYNQNFTFSFFTM